MTRFTQPKIDLPLHRQALRRVLLTSGRKDLPFSTMFIKRLLPAGLVLALLFGLTFALRPQVLQNTLAPSVNAEEFLDGVLSHVKNLTPEELNTLQIKLGEQYHWFKEAQGAEDLAYVEVQKKACEPEVTANDSYCLIYDYSTDLGGTVGMQAHSQEDQQMYDGYVALKYTTSEGAHVILLVDAELTPAVAFRSEREE